MKNMISFLIPFFFILNIYAKQTITIAVENAEFYPFQLGKKLPFDKNYPGISIELLVEVGKKLDIEIEFKRYPWKRCLFNLKENMIDGLILGSFNKKRSKFAKYPMENGEIDTSRRIATMSYVFYKNNDFVVKWDGKKLIAPGNRVGVTLGYSIIGNLNQMGIQTEETISYISNLKKVSAGRIPVCCDLEISVDYYLEMHKMEFHNITKLYPPLKIKPYYLLLSNKFVKENPKLSEKIWNEIRKYRTSSEYKKLVEKYMK